MSIENDKVLVTKQALVASLGDETWTRYLVNMKLWFRQKYTKNEFDMACRKLLTASQGICYYIIVMFTKQYTPIYIKLYVLQFVCITNSCWQY